MEWISVCIDMDIKDRKKAEILKDYIFNDLKKYNWFLGVVFVFYLVFPFICLLSKSNTDHAY